MIFGPLQRTRRQRSSVAFFIFAALLSFIAAPQLRADEPYARSRDYDLQHSKISLRFDLEQKKVIGDVTHSVSILRDGTTKIAFDSVGLTIHSVTLNKSAVKFVTTADKLIVPLPGAAKDGDKFEISIRYDGKPSKGMYFILPDKDYPHRPRQIWTQGEAEDTRYYLPTYDYPNDRLTTETILTVPASWLTVSNGRLISVTDAGKGLKTWYWKESLASSTYLITVVAGEFEELKDSWRGIPLAYYAPKGRGDRLAVNYGRTPAMMELFVRKFGVEYPWEKYAQSMVDDFVAGGMENSSATTNNSSSLVHPKLVHEYLTGEDDLIAHELTHQWFGDLVTCKDWGNVWLNEGFASFGETMWKEAHYGKDQADYERWIGFREWFGEVDLYNKPIVRRDFDADEFDDNVYDKSGQVLYMLRRELGDDAFYAGLKRYLEANRGKNVVTADFAKAVEEATHVNIDEFLGQWIYGAGAPRFELSYAYDNEQRQLALTVKQTQKIEGQVGIFRVPIEVEITTASGPKLYPATVSKANQIFTFPSDAAPLMVLFDKGGQVLKSASFHKEKKEWMYQAKHATEVSDRADAVLALAKIRGDEDVIAALGDVLQNDKCWGVRANAADALGQLGGATAGKLLLKAVDTNEEPWLRARIVIALGNFSGNAEAIEKLEGIAEHDRSYRARAAALEALGMLKTPNAFATLEAAAAADSPDGFLRKAALRAFGSLGDDKAVPLLLEWSSIGKPIDARTSAIYSLARLQKDNKDITEKIASYLTEAHFPVRMASIYALGWRGDASAIPSLESLLKSDDLTIEMVPMIKNQIARLKKPMGTKPGTHSSEKEEDTDTGTPPNEKNGDDSGVSQRLDKLERLVREMNERLKAIESRLPPPKN
jgi:aminopeptidase N